MKRIKDPERKVNGNGVQFDVGAPFNGTFERSQYGGEVVWNEILEEGWEPPLLTQEKALEKIYQNTRP